MKEVLAGLAMLGGALAGGGREIQGQILVLDREGRSSVVEAFRRAGWKPGKNYSTYSPREGDVTARYYTHATKPEHDRLNAVLKAMWEEGHRGFDLYLDHR
jgi:hypothetical protein